MPTTPHWNSQANEIFLQAVQLTDPDRRMAFLADACRDDLAMRVEVEELLLANEEAGDFLEEPLSRLPAALIPPEAEPPLTHVGPYRLLEPPIGEGGMGVVYKAVQETPVRRQVALKVIKPGLDTRQVIRRFEAERQVLALMDHPNIARVLEAGATSAGRPYFVMELVMGVPITIFCDQHQLCRRDRLALFMDVCHAVQHAHQKGIIHRDLKPSNILVTAPEGRPTVKVIDFGIAKAIGENPADHTAHTGSAQFIGTPLYMSPEQATLTAVDVDTRSDVYSLGVLLYELLTGTTPVHQETLRKSPDTEVRRIVCEDDPPLPSQRVKTLTPEALRTLGESEPVDAGKLSRQLAGELDWIVMQAIEKDRDRRYESASALAADVGRCLNDETVLACPPSTLYRLRKLARRNRGALTTGVLIVAALLSGTAVATWQAVEANRARNRVDALLLVSQNEQARANDERNRAKASAEDARWHQYAGEVQLAMRAWQRNDVRQMNEFLARHVPEGDENDLRGFEWHFLTRHSDLSSREISRSDSAYHIVRLSPDGTRIAVAGADGRIRLLSSRTFETELTIDARQSEVNGLDFASDGSMLASGGDDGTVALWNARNGDEIERFTAHDGAVFQVLFTQANQQLITCGRAPEIRIWNIPQANLHGELKHHTNDVESLSLSKSGLLAAGSSDETTSVWNVTQQHPVWHGSSDPPSKIKVVAFSPSGEWLATGHDLGLLTIRRTDRGNFLAQQEFPDTVESIAFAPAPAGDDSTWMAVGDRGGVVTLVPWDDHSRHSALLRSAATSQSGRQWQAHSGRVYSVAFTADGDRLLTAGADGVLKAWDIDSADTSRILPLKASDFVEVGAGWIVTVGETLSLHDVSGEHKGQQLLDMDDRGEHVRNAADSGQVFIKHLSGRILAMQPDGLGSPTVWNLAQYGNVGAFAVQPDGTGLAVETVDPTETVKALRFPQNPSRTAIPVTSMVRTLEYLPNGDLVFDQERDICIVNPATGERVRTLGGHRSTIHHLAISPNGDLLASASKDRTVRVWDWRTGRELWSQIAHPVDTKCVAFSPDGETLATTGADGMLRLWRWQKRSLVLEYALLNSPVDKLAFSRSGQQIITLAGKQVRIYDAQPTNAGPTVTKRGFATER